MNNVMVVPGEQQRDSAIHIHVSVLPHTPLPSSMSQLLAHNTEYNSMCYAVGLCCLSVLKTAVCT